MIFNLFIAWIMGKIYGARFSNKYLGDDQGFAKLYVVKRLLPKWAIGQAIGNSIFVLEEYKNDTRLLKHEYTHVKQYRRWGMFFLPAYFGASLLALLRHGPKNAYSMNVFEREANEKH